MVGRVVREESGVSVKGIKCKVNPENLLQFANGVSSHSMDRVEFCSSK